MNFISKYKKIILATIVIMVLFFAYNFFFGGKQEGDELISGTINQRTAADVVGAEIIQALNQIESLKLDRTIFEDPVYRSLIDRSEPIPSEPVGKTNPFDPISQSNQTGQVVEIPQEEESIEQSN